MKKSNLSPVNAYTQLCTAIIVSNSAPLFLLSNNKVNTYNKFQNKVRETIKKLVSTQSSFPPIRLEEEVQL